VKALYSIVKGTRSLTAIHQDRIVSCLSVLSAAGLLYAQGKPLVLVKHLLWRPIAVSRPETGS